MILFSVVHWNVLDTSLDAVLSLSPSLSSPPLSPSPSTFLYRVSSRSKSSLSVVRRFHIPAWWNVFQIFPHSSKLPSDCARNSTLRWNLIKIGMTADGSRVLVTEWHDVIVTVITWQEEVIIGNYRHVRNSMAVLCGLLQWWKGGREFTICWIHEKFARKCLKKWYTVWTQNRLCTGN